MLTTWSRDYDPGIRTHNDTMPEISRRSCGVTDDCCIGSWHGVIHLEEEIETLGGGDGRWEKIRSFVGPG
jgi:hypothetical protein